MAEEKQDDAEQSEERKEDARKAASRREASGRKPDRGVAADVARGEGLAVRFGRLLLGSLDLAQVAHLPSGGRVHQGQPFSKRARQATGDVAGSEVGVDFDPGIDRPGGRLARRRTGPFDQGEHLVAVPAGITHLKQHAVVAASTA